MNKEQISSLINKQKEFFKTGKTLEASFIISKLKKLKKSIKSHEKDIYKALKLDLNKCITESYISEISIVYHEIDYMLKKARGIHKIKRVSPSLSLLPASGNYCRVPYGNVLVLSPWNYPFNLCLIPVVGAIATGNCVLIKVSKTSSNTSKIIKTIIDEVFSDEHVYCIPVDTEYDDIIDQKYDFVFFTGSTNVGKMIMKKAAENLTPVILELGGKSPCIVDKSANLNIAAERIVFGKLMNSGQTCVSPDYFMVHESIKDNFVKAIQEKIKKFYGDSPHNNNDFAKIINKKHFDRLNKLISNHPSKVIGGRNNSDSNTIEPAILLDCNFESEIMQNEIFGPILPILTFSNLDDALVDIQDNLPTPLAFYIYTSNIKKAKNIAKRFNGGGCCINDCLVHVSSSKIPFGGVGTSGVGYYHGKFSIRAFTRARGIVVNSNRINMGLRNPPYKNLKKKILQKLV